MPDLDPELFPKAVAKGVDLLRRGVTDFPKWSQAMVYQFGEPIRPHLERIWGDVQEEFKRSPIAAPSPPPEDQPSGVSEQTRSRPRRGSRILAASAVCAIIAGLLLASGWIWRRERTAKKTNVEAAETAKKGPARNSPAGFDPTLLEPVAPDDSTELLARAEKGDAEAQLSLGLRYFWGDGVRQDYAEAARWLRKAAERGNAKAQQNLGMLYATGQGVRRDYVEAAKWYLKAAEQGDAIAQYNLGVYYGEGKGVQQNHTEAAKWYLKAAEQGDASAQHNLGVSYEQGEGVPEDSAEAVKWYRKAADQGDAYAQNNLGGCYGQGEGVQQNHTEAAKWYRKAAEQGNAYGQYNLGLCYSDGIGVAKGIVQDHTEAAKWFRKAAEEGLAGAQSDLGLCYAQGKGVVRDFTKAVGWLRRAADQGDAAAQHNLGAMHSKGEGFPQNDIEAYKWFSLAAAQGRKESAEGRDWVSQRMARAEVVEGQRRAAAFVARAESPGDSGGFSRPAQPRFADPGLKACGTAFFVSVDGYLLSNYHVVERASTVKVKTSSGILRASVVKTDPVNDIAVLKVSGSFRALPLANRREVKLGETVFTVGFPNIQLQGREPKLTKGEISSLSGAQDDPRHFQISVAVQPGNSGGPLVDSSGNVIGIVTAQLSDAAALEVSGALPQNVNYATKSSYAVPLLESVPGLAAKLKAPHAAKERKFEDAVQETREATALVLVY